MIYSLFITFLLINLTVGYTEYFDNDYYAYPKDDSLASFGYDNSRVCTIRKIGSSYYSGLSDAYTVFKTPYTKLQNIISSEIYNCFNYKAYSYIFSLINNTTTIMRGHLSKNFKFQNYNKLIFDHLYSKLYSIDGNKISEINMTMLENFWLIDNYPQKLLQTMRNISLNHMFVERNYLTGKIDDVTIFNDTAYFIRSGKIYKQNIKSKHEEFISDWDKNFFDVIPFLQITKYYQDNPKIKFGSISPTIIVSLPSSSIKSKEELSMPLQIMLYFLDAMFVILTVWVLKHLFKSSKEKYEKFKTTNRNSNIEENISLASLPYRDIIVSKL